MRAMLGQLSGTAALGVVLAFAGCADGGASEDGGNLVHDYCSYGAVSEAQLEGCVDHVTPEVVEGYDTNAGRYARRELDACLADAGPFCEDR
jgi:hypothetical protein